MSRKLEELFNLDSSDESSESIVEEKDDATSSSEFITPETLDVIEKIERALPQVRDLEASDAEMDELAESAKNAFNNLMDLGMQVDSRFSAEIFNSAGGMLGHAITAKTAKINKKLKMIDLQLKKAELERKISSVKKGEVPPPIEGTGKVVDRNELIKILIAEAANKKQQKDK